MAILSNASPVLRRAIGVAPPAQKKAKGGKKRDSAAPFRIPAIGESVCRIFDTLTRSRQLDNTAVVFTSDNGYFWGEHGQGRRTDNTFVLSCGGSPYWQR